MLGFKIDGPTYVFSEIKSAVINNSMTESTFAEATQLNLVSLSHKGYDGEVTEGVIWGN